MQEDKVFELLTEMYSKITEQFKEVNERIDGIDKKLDGKADKKDIARLEHELYPKIQALFDGYKQHADQLERIEKEVTRQDEFILRRMK